MMKFIILKLEGRYIKVFIEKILFCKADGSYTKFYFDNHETLLVSMMLKEVEEILALANFFRINRSHLINLEHCYEIIINGANKVVLCNGATLTVSRSRKKQLIKDFCTYM